MTGFKAIAAEMRGNDTMTAQIPESWRQGRTAYGGLTTGLALSAVMTAFPGLPPLRSVQMTFVGPVTVDPVFTPVILRRGRNVTSVRVDASIDAQIVATAVFIFGGARESTVSAECPAPDAPPPEACEPFTPPEIENLVPSFFLRFDTRLVAGARPTSGAKEGYIRVWSRHKDEASRDGAASFLTIGDVLPPAAMPTFKTFGPVRSVNWQVNVLRPITTENGWWHVETRQTAAQDGYSSQVMRYWNTNGNLVAEGMQSVAIFV